MIGKVEYMYEESDYRVDELEFYAENPRIYSALNISEGIPEQYEIEELLTNMEHVKQLKLSIEANGGLIDPLIIRAGDNIVLEGNSRLAAYRILVKKDPFRWGKVKCKVLPASISDMSIFTLLGQYHIIGRKDWSPFEQAGYLYRRIKSSNIPIENVAEELGISKGIANKFIETYSFMVEKNDLRPGNWSYYEEYLKNNAIKKYRQTHANLDDVMAEKIKSGEIAQATDIRNKLGEIAKVDSKYAKKIMSNISNGKINIYEGFEQIEGTGKTGNIYKTLFRFRTKINEHDFWTSLSCEDLKQINFELIKIRKIIDKFIQKTI